MFFYTFCYKDILYFYKIIIINKNITITIIIWKFVYITFKNINITIENNIKEEILELSNYELFGARKIEKIIKNNIENIIIDKIINNIHDITISSILIKE